jgi:hypothetical protein
LALVAVPRVDTATVAASASVTNGFGSVVRAVVSRSASQVTIRISIVSSIAETTIFGFVDVGRTLVTTSRTSRSRVPTVFASALTLFTVLSSLSDTIDSESITRAIKRRSAETFTDWIVGESNTAGGTFGLLVLRRTITAIGASELILALTETSSIIVACDIRSVCCRSAVVANCTRAIAVGEVFESRKARTASSSIVFGRALTAVGAEPRV